MSLFGIAGNFAIDASKTFFGFGFVPSDREQMSHWDEYGICSSADSVFRRSGLQRQRREPRHHRHRAGAHARPVRAAEDRQLPAAARRRPPAPVPTRRRRPRRSGRTRRARPRPRAARASGDDAAHRSARARRPAARPTSSAFYVIERRSQGVKELDDMYVGMNIALAQQLLYGRGEHKAVSIVIQLHTQRRHGRGAAPG